MTKYMCPVCGKSWLSWDARSQLFVCLSAQCGAFFEVPSSEQTSHATTSQLISQGRLSIVPAWFARQANRPQKSAS